MKDNTSPLSMSRFRLSNGDFKALDDMSAEEKVAFCLASAMKKIIENLEISINNERVFNRAKFNTMQIFHQLHEDIDGKKKETNERNISD